MDCQGCGLCPEATQTVVLRVGPGGGLIHRAFDEAGIDRNELVVTNAVEHSKWAPSGSRRLHRTPSAREWGACRPWLLSEIHALAPALMVGLGATACQSLLGCGFRLSLHRHKIVKEPGGLPVVATIQPFAVLRMTGAEQSHAFDGLVEDLPIASAAV